MTMSWTQGVDRVAVLTGFWRTCRDHTVWQAEPNAAHRALAGLERRGVAVRILTQNVDGLHQRAGSSARKVLELHGSVHEVVCTGCGERTPSRATLDRVAAGDGDPRCAACGGIRKLAVVLFGENLDPGTAGLAERIASHSGVFLVVGSSLLVEPAASLGVVEPVGVARRGGSGQSSGSRTMFFACW